MFESNRDTHGGVDMVAKVGINDLRWLLEEGRVEERSAKAYQLVSVDDRVRQESCSNDALRSVGIANPNGDQHRLFGV